MIRFYGEVLGGQRKATLISKRSKRAHLEEAQNGRPHSGGKRAFGERGWRRVEDVLNPRLAGLREHRGQLL